MMTFNEQKACAAIARAAEAAFRHFSPEFIRSLSFFPSSRKEGHGG